MNEIRIGSLLTDKNSESYLLVLKYIPADLELESGWMCLAEGRVLYLGHISSKVHILVLRILNHIFIL